MPEAQVLTRKHSLAECPEADDAHGAKRHASQKVVTTKTETRRAAASTNTSPIEPPQPADADADAPSSAAPPSPPTTRSAALPSSPTTRPAAQPSSPTTPPSPPTTRPAERPSPPPTRPAAWQFQDPHERRRLHVLFTGTCKFLMNSKERDPTAQEATLIRKGVPRYIIAEARSTLDKGEDPERHVEFLLTPGRPPLWTQKEDAHLLKLAAQPGVRVSPRRLANGRREWLAASLGTGRTASAVQKRLSILTAPGYGADLPPVEPPRVEAPRVEPPPWTNDEEQHLRSLVVDPMVAQGRHRDAGAWIAQQLGTGRTSKEIEDKWRKLDENVSPSDADLRQLTRYKREIPRAKSLIELEARRIRDKEKELSDVSKTLRRVSTRRADDAKFTLSLKRAFDALPDALSAKLRRKLLQASSTPVVVAWSRVVVKFPLRSVEDACQPPRRQFETDKAYIERSIEHADRAYTDLKGEYNRLTELRLDVEARIREVGYHLDDEPEKAETVNSVRSELGI